MTSITRALAVSLLCTVLLGTVAAQTTRFSYQGRLSNGPNALSGTYQMRFALFDSLAGGNQIGATLIFDGNTPNPAAIPVTDGVFAVQLDFGAVPFAAGQSRYLEIAVKQIGETNYIVLAPRQPINSVPYAIRSVTAATADMATTAVSATNATNSGQLGGVPASQYLTNTAAIQNSTTQQTASNFNISGNGTAGGTLTANTVSATSQFNLGANRLLSIGDASLNNTFLGVQAGEANPTGTGNSLVGKGAGKDNSSGSFNSFFGQDAGQKNVVGSNNVFLGATAGTSTNADNNTFVGTESGRLNTTGNSNVALGRRAGITNSTGSNNTFLGANSGVSNTTENGNTFVGSGANGAASITNATAIGLNARVTTSNSMVLGTAAVTVQVPGNLTVTGTLNATLPAGNGNYVQNTTSQQANSNYNISGNGRVGGNLTVVGTLNAGTLNASLPANSPSYIQNSSNQQIANFNVLGNGTLTGIFSAGQYNIRGNPFLRVGVAGGAFLGEGTGTSGGANVFLGGQAGNANTTGGSNLFAGVNAGQLNTEGSSNVFVGTGAGSGNLTGSLNTAIGDQSGVTNTTGTKNIFIGSGANAASGSLTNATAIGSGALVSASNTMVLGSTVTAVQTGGTLTIGSLASSGGTNALCVNDSNLVTGCGRYNITIEAQNPGSYTLDHNLNTLDVQATVYKSNSDGTWSQVGIGDTSLAITLLHGNAMRLTISQTGTYRVLIWR
jgi:hypothetical protein